MLLQLSTIFNNTNNEGPLTTRANHFMRSPTTRSFGIESSFLQAFKKWWIAHTEIKLLIIPDHTNKYGRSMIILILTDMQIKRQRSYLHISFLARICLVTVHRLFNFHTGSISIVFNLSDFNQMRNMWITTNIFLCPLNCNISHICRESL